MTPPLEQEQARPCSACGGNAPLALVAHDTNRRISAVQFPYYQCRTCGFLFLEPIPADLGAYYPGDYHAIPRDEDELARKAEAERYKIDLVRRHATGGRLLEIGPSFGMFVHLARQAGFAVQGIEMSDECCRFLRSLGFEIHQSADPVSVLGSLKGLDVIALWHVFEHLPQPWVALQAMAGALAPGGILILAQPNPGSLQFRLLGRRWTHLDAPRHVHLSPTRLIAERAAACGLTLVSCGGNDPGGLGWNRFGWVHSLRNLSTWRPLRFVLHVLARALELLLMPLERSGGRGSTYTAVLRKPA